MMLYIHDDIEFMTPEQFDPPTEHQLAREARTAKVMDMWVQDYNERMEAKRESWLNEPHYDPEGWGSWVSGQ